MSFCFSCRDFPPMLNSEEDPWKMLQYQAPRPEVPLSIEEHESCAHARVAVPMEVVLSPGSFSLPKERLHPSGAQRKARNQHNLPVSAKCIHYKITLSMKEAEDKETFFPFWETTDFLVLPSPCLAALSCIHGLHFSEDNLS